MRLKQLLNERIEVINEHSPLELGSVIKIHGITMLKGLKEGAHYIVTGIDPENVTLKEANENGKTLMNSKMVSHPVFNVNEAIKMKMRGYRDGIEIVSESQLKEAVDVDFKDIKPQHQKMISALEKVLGGKYIMIWDGIHGMIVDIKVQGGHGAYRFDVDTMRRLVLLKVRWVENDGDRISIGF